MTVEQRLALVRARVEEARARARSRSDVQLIAVSKTVDERKIAEAYAAGQRVFGENRVQEALQKMDALSGTLDAEAWHLIGHIQTNKARAASRFAMIQSVDSVRIAEKLDRVAREGGRMLPVLLEVNVAAEDTKSGFAIEEVREAFADLRALDHLHLAGLMTVAPYTNDPETIRPVFRQLRELRDVLQEAGGGDGFCQLSMGMSNDFEVAIQEGATMIRVGRAIFGERDGLAQEVFR